jgi:AcrR family transcriptional regulator
MTGGHNGGAMGTDERRQREKAERRSLILEKAKALILERGVAAVSMQDLADACELSKATLYLYFDSKEALLADILDGAARDFEGYVRARMPEGASGLEAIHALWISFLHLIGDSEEIFVLMGIKNSVNPGFPLSTGQPDPATARMLSLVTEILQAGIADGSLRADPDPEGLARSLIMIATSLIDTATRVAREDRDLELLAHEMQRTFELLLRGIAAAGSDPALLKLPFERNGA